MHTDFARLAETGGGSMPVIGVASGSIGRVHKGEPLARYNLLRLTRDEHGMSVEFQARGLLAPSGAVVDLERRVLRPAVADSAGQA
jgi:hypothetical protein